MPSQPVSEEETGQQLMAKAAPSKGSGPDFCSRRNGDEGGGED